MNTVTIKVPAASPRAAVYVACVKRYANTTKAMKDRRQPRGGNRNKQRDYRDGDY